MVMTKRIRLIGGTYHSFRPIFQGISPQNMDQNNYGTNVPPFPEIAIEMIRHSMGFFHFSDEHPTSIF